LEEFNKRKEVLPVYGESPSNLLTGPEISQEKVGATVSNTTTGGEDLGGAVIISKAKELKLDFTNAMAWENEGCAWIVIAEKLSRVEKEREQFRQLHNELNGDLNKVIAENVTLKEKLTTSERKREELVNLLSESLKMITVLHDETGCPSTICPAHACVNSINKALAANASSEDLTKGDNENQNCS
jgi:hypothetical protein